MTAESSDVANDDADAGRPTDVWRRGDRQPRHAVGDIGIIPFDDLHLHRYCDVIPIRLVDRRPGTDDSGKESERPTGFFLDLPGFDRSIELFPPEDETRGGASGVIRYLPTRSESPTDDQPDWPLNGLFSGTVRTALQYTPLLVAIIALAFLVSAELSPSVQGISAYLPGLPVVVVPILGVTAIAWAILLYLVVGAGLVSARELTRVVGVFGLVGLLALGTAGSIYLVVTSPDPRELPPNIIYTSGYLLVVLVGGLLTYDGMLRTEYLFNNLDKKLVIEDESRYADYRERIATNLRDPTRLPLVGPVPTYLLFAVMLVSQFAALWLLSSGPQGLTFSVTLVGNIVVDLVMAIIYFQLFVLIKAFHDLVTGNVALGPMDGDNPERYDLLSYRPFHPDGRGGFRDLGKFATRVNVLLLLGGFYVIYRLYVQGARTLPSSGVTLSIDPTLAVLVWLVSYVGPVIVLIVVGFAWLYYSFWMLHVKMSYERERHYTEHLRNKSAGGTDGDPPIGSVEHGLEWQEARQPAPVWPVNARVLASLVSSTFIPLLLALPRLFL